MEFQDLTGASTGQTLVTKYRFNRLNQSPFFVGQKIVLKADIANAGTGGNQVDKPAVISSINWNTTLGDANAGYITLEFEQAPFTALDGNGESYENVSAVPAVWTSASFTYDFAEIVLKEVGSPQGADSLAYKTYHTTQDNGNGLLSYQGQFVLRPATNNMLILFPTDTSDLQSNNEQLKSYNIRVNNEDLIDNREVTFRTPLQLDRINMTLSNMDIGAENLLQNAGSSNIGSVYRYLEPTNGLGGGGGALAEGVCVGGWVCVCVCRWVGVCVCVYVNILGMMLAYKCIHVHRSATSCHTSSVRCLPCSAAYPSAASSSRNCPVWCPTPAPVRDPVRSFGLSTHDPF